MAALARETRDHVTARGGGPPRWEARLEPDELDGQFPLGDGTAETEAVVVCPYCGEEEEIGLDPGGGSVQRYVQDCAVCCQPWSVEVRYDELGGAAVSVRALDE